MSFELKPIAPGLLSDPAFSADPLAHPYHSFAWPISPPVGHPVIKNRNPRPFTLTDPDSEFRLIQPPNSPVSDIAAQDSPRFPFPPPTTPTNSPAAASSPPVTRPQPSTKPGRKFRMPFLTRRKTTQPQPTDSPLVPKKVPAPAHPTHDVTQPPRPAARRAISERITPRPVTSGTDTPRSTAPSSTNSSVSKRLVEGLSGRNQDLDRIDELDETSPWGISLHHGGPYEAAVQAIRRSDHRMPLGILNSTGRANEYHKQAMLAYGNVYIPPQVPTGVSLKLSPGQILPRNFNDLNDQRRAVRPPRVQNLKSQRELPVNLSPNPQIFFSPPSVANYPSSQLETRPPQPESSISRRQSQVQPPSLVVESGTHGDLLAPSSQARPLPSPLPNPHATLSSDTKPNPERETSIARNQSRPVTSLSPSSSAPSMQTQSHNTVSNPDVDDSSLSIGMAMLEPEVDAAEFSPPEIYLHTKVPEEVQDFDPYDLIHMKNEHSRTSSPSESTPQDNSRAPSPKSLPRMADQGSQDPSKIHENLTVSTKHPVSLPPPYSSTTAESEIRHQPQPVSTPHQVSRNSPAQSRIHTPEPAPSMKSNGPARSDESGHSSHGFKGSHDNLSSENSSIIQPRKQGSPQETQPMPPTRRERNSVQLQPLAPSNHDRERDGKSTHQSISTHSSGQNRYSLQPPPRRHLPKRLVMPAPLNTSGLVSPPQQRVYQLPPATQFPRQMQVQFRPRSQEYLSPPDSLLLPPILGNSMPLEPQMAASRKLKKRASMITPSSNSTPPIITTVSFVPPVIGFQPHEKMMMHSKSEKVAKRVLSKRRTDL